MSMRILLDESVPRKLRWRFDDNHEVVTVDERGWKGTKNGELIERAAIEFDVLVTTDQQLQYQQNLSTVSLAVIVLAARSNRYEDLLPLVADVMKVLKTIRPGEVVVVAT